MRIYRLPAFGAGNLKLHDGPPPTAGPGEIVVEVRALSLNFRDILVIEGKYNPRLTFPFTPISDAAGVVTAVGAGVARLHVGQRVATHFVADWLAGPFRDVYRNSTLGAPGPGLAAQQVALPADAAVPLPESLSFEEGATLPIAALTAWSALVTEGGLTPAGSNEGKWVLALGTGGVSIFTLQLAQALGARVIITSSSDEKLERARALGADVGLNYRTRPDWEKSVLEATGGLGADLVVETAGGALNQSLRATRAGGVVALLGVLAGVNVELATTPVLMRRLRIAGVMVDSRAAYEALLRFMVAKQVRPVIDRRFGFDELPGALQHMQSGRHFGKIVVTM